MLPYGRKEGLLSEEVGDELMVYDQKTHRAHVLNRTTALVWQHCDGKTTMSHMTNILSTQLGLPADENLVWLALEQLSKARLVEKATSTQLRPEFKMTRRNLIKKMAVAAMLIPAIASISAPKPADAASGVCGAQSGNCTGYCQVGSCKQVSMAGTCSCV